MAYEVFEKRVNVFSSRTVLQVLQPLVGLDMLSLYGNGFAQVRHVGKVA